MEEILREFHFLGQIPIHYFVQLLMAAICGSAVGIEREMRRKSAGIRTNAMICIGSALYVIASQFIISHVNIQLTGSTDTTRIAGQVVVGMGFIGAGSIIQSRGHVMGLTTAATLWVVAAIGVIIGVGYPLFALIVTAFVVVVLVGVGKIEHLVLGKCRHTSTRISFRDDAETMAEIQEVLVAHSKDITELTIVRENNICFADLTYCHVHPEHSEWFYELLRIPDVRQTKWHR